MEGTKLFHDVPSVSWTQVQRIMEAELFHDVSSVSWNGVRTSMESAELFHDVRSVSWNHVQRVMEPESAGVTTSTQNFASCIAPAYSVTLGKGESMEPGNCPWNGMQESMEPESMARSPWESPWNCS